VVGWVYTVSVYLPAGKVPEDILLAFRAVRLTPLAAGKVAGNLASATIPVKLAAVKLVNPLPSPTSGLFNVILPVPVLVSKLSTFIVLIE
jgi:hypothetical protein